MKFRYFALTFLTATILSHSVQSQEITSEYIDALVETAFSTSPNAGVAIAVVKDGKVIHARGYGITSAETQAAVDENTLFSIASNSKAFTTMALGMLVDEGKLNWTDRVIDHIPEFKMYDSYVTEHFTILDLITHRSGLGLGAGDLMFIPDGSDFKIDDILTSFQHQEPTSEFRTKYDYDNLLYIVAGEVIHRVSGLPWDEFIETRIMKPLGMERSAGYFENLTTSENIAQPHSVENGELLELDTYLDPNKVFGAAGGIYASVNDLSKWMLMQLADGKYGAGQELVSAENHHEMWKAHTNIRFNAVPGAGYGSHYKAYGLGWFLEDQNGYTIVSHSGGMPGMLSQTILIPELNAGVVVLTNCAPGGYSYYALSHSIKDAIIGAEGNDWIEMANSWISGSNHEADSVVNHVWETVKANKKHKINFRDFIGTYEDDWFGEVTIEDREGKLWFSSKRSPKLNGEMFFYQANTFAIKWEYEAMYCDAFALFTLDEFGVAQEITMKGISPDIDFSFDFQDLDFKRIK
ncbi:MAG: serine hydrolase [Crocinitomicaceae bacterium]|nr:serine hydrolase [Crocinitomicaceae bacterium]